MKHLIRWLIPPAVVLWSAGCATMLSGTQQRVTVTSNPPGATVVVGHQTAVTPVTVIVPKGKDVPIEVAQGPDRRVVSLHRSVDPATFLNLIPPLWPGFLVDAFSGAFQHYDPAVVHVDFRAPPTSSRVHVVRYRP